MVSNVIHVEVTLNLTIYLKQIKTLYAPKNSSRDRQTQLHYSNDTSTGTVRRTSYRIIRIWIRTFSFIYYCRRKRMFISQSGMNRNEIFKSRWEIWERVRIPERFWRFNNGTDIKSSIKYRKKCTFQCNYNRFPEK